MEQPPDEADRRNDWQQYVAHHLHAERRAVHLFLEAADRLGIATPISYEKTPEENKLIQEMFDGHGPPPLTSPADGRLTAFALAQHHGVPTRLLDWTEAPLIAAFFAAHGALKAYAADPNQPRIGVFFLRTFAVESEVSGVAPLDLVRVPRHANTYLLQQRGVFINLKEANKFFLEKGEWPSLLDAISTYSHLQLHRVTLPASEAREVLRILFDHDISPVRLQPTLDRVAASFGYAADLFG